MEDHPVHYFMTCVYGSGNKTFELVGVLKIHTDKSITGRVMDLGDGIPFRKVEGKLLEVDGVSIIDITKPTSGNRFIFKGVPGGFVEGRYEGVWRCRGENPEREEREYRSASMSLRSHI